MHLRNACTPGHSIIYSVVKKVLLDLLRRDMYGKTLERNIITHFSANIASCIIYVMLLSANSFVDLIAEFINYRTGEIIKVKPVTIKMEMEEQMNGHMVQPVAKHTKSKYGSLPTRVESTLSSSFSKTKTRIVSQQSSFKAFQLFLTTSLMSMERKRFHCLRQSSWTSHPPIPNQMLYSLRATIEERIVKTRRTQGGTPEKQMLPKSTGLLHIHPRQ